MEYFWMTLLKEKKGVTLVELLVVLAITGIVMIAVGEFFLQGIRGFNLARDEEMLHSQASRIIASIDEDIMEANGIRSVSRDVRNNITGIVMNVELPRMPTALTPEIQRVEYRIMSDVFDRVQRDTSDNILRTRNLVKGNTVAWVLEPVRVTADGAVESISTPMFTSDSDNDFTSADTLGLHYVITLRLNNAENIIENTVFFRNK